MEELLAEAARLGVEVRAVALPPGLAGLYVRRRGRAVILLARGLSARQARCALAEELVHHRRGGRLLDCPPSIATLREEALVAQEVADWLLPDAALAPLLREARASGEERLWEWAEELGVTETVLRRKCRLLRQRGWQGYAPWWEEGAG